MSAFDKWQLFVVWIEICAAFLIFLGLAAFVADKIEPFLNKTEKP